MPIVVDKNKKRKEIIEAAIAVFSREGYHRTKINDIADGAGVGKGTIYEYFDSKEDLFLHMCEYMYEQYHQSQKMSLEAFEDPQEQLRSLITRTIEDAAMWTALIYLNIDVWSEMDRKGEEDKLRKTVMGMFNRMKEVVGGCIREGREKGVFKDLDTERVTLIFLATLDGLMFQLLLDKEMFDPEAMAKTLSELLLDGLRK